MTCSERNKLQAVISRPEMVLWAVALLVINDGLSGMLTRQTVASSPYSGLDFGFNAFDVLALCVIVWRLWLAPREIAGRAEIAIILSFCLMAGLGPHAAAPLAMTLLAGFIALRTNPQIKAAAVVLLALASHQLWAPLTFKLIAPELISLDAAMVGQAVRLTTPGAQWAGNVISVPNGHAIAILEGCSSFTNVSGALLAWVSLAKLERPNWVRADLLVGLASIVAQVSFNVLRLIQMAQSYAAYVYWHDGAGQIFYVMSASSVAVLIGVVGARWAGQR